MACPSMDVLERNGSGLRYFGGVLSGYRGASWIFQSSRDNAQTRALLKRTRLSNELSQSLSRKESGASHVPIPLSLVSKEQQ